MTSEITTPSIDYIEVGLCEKKLESIGLLSSYNFLQDGIYIIPKMDGEGAYFNLKYFAITFIRIGYEEKYEEYFFKDTEEEQDEAKQTLISLITILKLENRCSKSEFIKTDSYVRIPSDYKNSRLSKNTVKSDTTTKNIYGAPHGGARVVGHTTTATTTAYPQQSKIIFIKRKTELPKKNLLKVLAERVAQGNIQVELPVTAEDDEPATTKTYDYDDDTYASMYGGAY